MQIVSPYRPFPAESPAHRKLGPFDWIGALRMLAESASRVGPYPVFAITDRDTTLPVPAFAYQTDERRLMLWILEVSLRYLESADFTQDTVMMSPDTLVLKPLTRFFAGDLTILARPSAKYTTRPHHPIINAVQWWPVRSRGRLIAFYRRVLALARTLPGNVIEWGADTAALVQLLSPITIGLCERDGMQVFMLDARQILTGSVDEDTTASIAHFKYRAKAHMAEAFSQLMATP